MNHLWLRVFNRPISPAERDDALAFLAQHDATLQAKDATAQESLSWQELCHSLLASNEFLWRI